MNKFLHRFRSWVVQPVVVLLAVPMLPIAIVLGLLWSAVSLNLFILYYVVDPIAAKRWWHDR